MSFGVHGGSIKAVRGVSFDIPRGKTVALVGESGSGKSVTAQSILRILPTIGNIDSGRILFAPDEHQSAIDLTSLEQDGDVIRGVRGGQIAMIFQEPMVSLSPLHTIGDQVSEALFLHRKVSKAEGMELTTDTLAKAGFPNPKQALNTYPFELSGGLRQRAMIAMALVCRPRLLIADEPTTALDVTIQAQILELIHSLQAELDMAVLLITHDLGVVANVADDVIVMYHGEIMESGNVHQIYQSPQHPYLKALMRAVPHFDMKPGERLQPVREIEYQLGDLFKDSARQATKDLPKIALRADNLRKFFTIRNQSWLSRGKPEQIKAVNDVSFEIQRGTCFGLVGESGCGKTTLSKLLMRAVTADSGSLKFYDHEGETDLFALKDAALLKFRKKMQFVFQDPFGSLNPRMTVFDLVREPLIIHGNTDEDENADHVKQLMHLVGLDPRFLNRYPHSFSGGQRQRIGIARALALRPGLLILDEPVSALDVSIQAQILNLLKDLQAELSLTYLFISHNLAVVDYVADRIAVMCRGHIVEIAPREVLFNNPLHPYTQALLNAVPFADLKKKLDFNLLKDTRASEPEHWPAPFGIRSNSQSELTQHEDEHWVRVVKNETTKAQAA